MAEAKTKTLWNSPAALLTTAVFHSLGAITVFLVMVSVTLGPDVVLGLTRFVWANEVVQDAVLAKVLIQFGLACCFWAMAFIFYKSIDLSMLTKKTPRVVRRAKGTVITETLIALPVLLLLILGMLQLSVNNMAGILKHVADFQAARTVWVWEGEGISDAQMEERVRIAVALVMTPVSPNSPEGVSGRAGHTQDIMVERFNTGLPSNPFRGRSTTNMSVMSALDGHASLTRKASGKFSYAYNNTEVHRIVEGAEVGADFTFYHFQAMPLVGRIFGEGSGNAYFQPIEVQARMPRQMYGVGRP